MKFIINNPIRLIELFAGVGSQAMALRDIGADFEHYRVVEFDKYPVASYNAIHGTNFPTLDITKITGADLGITEVDKFTYLLTYSFPCQDLSVAGRGGGMTKGSGTRSGLLWEVERLLNETENLPQVLVMENVPQVHSKKNMPDFQNWLNYLESRGYKTFWQDLNAMDYGIPQSRNRCIAVSILGDYEFDFPAPMQLETVMGDYLETDVDEKYYLTSDKAKDLIDRLIIDGKVNPALMTQGGDRALSYVIAEAQMKPEHQTQGTQTLQLHSCPEITRGCPTMEVMLPLSARKSKCVKEETPMPKIEIIGCMDNKVDHTFESANRVYGAGGLAPTIPTCAGGGIQPKIMEVSVLPEEIGNKSSFKIRQATKQGYIECESGGGADLNYPNSQTRRGRVIEHGRVCPTLTTTSTPCVLEKFVYEIDGELYLVRIRKLTPLECWRLMGFDDTDYEKAASVNSNTQLYKQAGNSIVKQVLMNVFSQMIPSRTRVSVLQKKALALLDS